MASSLPGPDPMGEPGGSAPGVGDSASATATAAPVLTVDGVTLKFGGLTALDNVTFDIRAGEILGLIGPNGAGKTTCFNVMTGVYQPTSGGVLFQGQSLRGLKKHQITKLGIARTFQNIRLFKTMTALENVLVGTDARHRSGAISALFRLPKQRREEAEGHAEAMRLLKFMGLHRQADELAANLSYGDQRRLEIARAMATKPTLLCLDEPAAGFNPAEKQQLMDLIRRVRDQGFTVLLIEHDMRLVMGVTDRIVVLEFGKKIAEGSPEDIRNDPAVIAAYLGTSADEVTETEAAGLAQELDEASVDRPEVPQTTAELPVVEQPAQVAERTETGRPDDEAQPSAGEGR